VFGLEHEAQFTKLNGNVTAPSGVTDPFAQGDNFNASVDYLGATRAKIGWAWNRYMIYAAGGLESGEMDVTANYASRGGLGAGAPLRFSDAHKLQFG
jgi:hypothetical protein